MDVKALDRRARFAGGRAYGYRKARHYAPSGDLVPGIVEIDEEQANFVERIFEAFASGQSAVQIAKDLNGEGIPSPRGGQWNASTIRGDPKKANGCVLA